MKFRYIAGVTCVLHIEFKQLDIILGFLTIEHTPRVVSNRHYIPLVPASQKRSHGRPSGRDAGIALWKPPAPKKRKKMKRICLWRSITWVGITRMTDAVNRKGKTVLRTAEEEVDRKVQFPISVAPP